MGRPALIVFDVNETLLDLSPVGGAMGDSFGDAPPIGEWFARLLHGSLLANELDAYRAFGEIAVDALIGVARRRGVDLEQGLAREIVQSMEALPPHRDVVPAITRMADGGIPMITLTNGGEAAARAQMENAGLSGMLEAVLSVDAVGKFKPHSAPYRYAAEVMGVEPGEMTMVAAHDWDCAGAMRAGCRAVFVERPGATWGLPLPPRPQTVKDIGELADTLLG